METEVSLVELQREIKSLQKQQEKISRVTFQTLNLMERIATTRGMPINQISHEKFADLKENEIKPNIPSTYKVTFTEQPFGLKLIPGAQSYGAFVTECHSQVAEITVQPGSQLMQVNDKPIQDVPFKEITSLLSKIEMPAELQFQVPTMPIEVLELFNAINTDGSGCITFEQFAKVLDDAHKNDPYTTEKTVAFDDGDYGLAVKAGKGNCGCFVTRCRSAYAQQHVLVGSQIVQIGEIKIRDMPHEEIIDFMEQFKNKPRNLKFIQSDRAAKLVEIFNKSDRNNSGTVDFEEFVNACADPEINMAAVSELANFGPLGDEIRGEIQQSTEALVQLKREMANVNDIGDLLKDIRKELRLQHQELRTELDISTETIRKELSMKIDALKAAGLGGKGQQAARGKPLQQQADEFKNLKKYFGLFMVQEKFSEFDVDGNAKISYDEFKQCLKDLEIDVPDILIRKMFTCMDDDNSNTIELDEFLAVLKKSVRTEGAGDFRTIFRATMTRLVAEKQLANLASGK